MAMDDRRWWCLTLVLLIAPFMASSSSIVTTLPGYSAHLPFNLQTGYIGVGENDNTQLFYLFVESQSNPSEDPVLLWFVGGPGCSGFSAFFFEHGPLIFDGNYSGTLPTLKLNPYTWTQVLNIIYIDMPVGTGFSYSKTQDGYHSSATLWVDNSYEFLQKWLIDHPGFGSNPLYIGGGSYSTLPITSLVLKVYQGFKAGSIPLMNIKGYVMASPLADTYMDVNMRVSYAHQLSIIPDDLYESLKSSCNGDYININPNNTQCVLDYEAYSELVRYINIRQILEPVCITIPNEKERILLENSPEEILQSLQRSPCRDYDNMRVEQWVNDEEVRKALHIREGTKLEFLRCNRSVSYTHDIASVLHLHRRLTNTHLLSLIFCADLDLEIPHVSTQSWIKSLNLKIQDRWRAWFVEGQVAGYTEVYKKNNFYLTYASVKGAGHVAQQYKPKEVYQMIKRWFLYSPI